MSLALYPAINLGKTELKIRESISRLSTGLKILGESSGSLSQGITLNAEAKSNQSAISASEVGIDLLLAAEAALIELASLAERLREIGIADTDTTNDANDTAALNAEATSVSDTIDDIVTALKFNGVAILGTSSKTFAVVKDQDGNTTSVKTTDGITATNVSDATNANTAADTLLGEITESQGDVSAGISTLGGYRNASTSMKAIQLQSASRLMDTNFALETAKLLKNKLISSYANNMISEANNIEKDKLITLA